MFNDFLPINNLSSIKQYSIDCPFYSWSCFLSYFPFISSRTNKNIISRIFSIGIQLQTTVSLIRKMTIYRYIIIARFQLEKYVFFSFCIFLFCLFFCGDCNLFFKPKTKSFLVLKYSLHHQKHELIIDSYRFHFEQNQVSYFPFFFFTVTAVCQRNVST